MSQDIRRELIGRNLGIKPINHGQVYAFQIALPDSRQQETSLEKRQAIERSLLEHKTNIVSLIIRRTDDYDDEDIEYELVYGANWLKIAQELGIEKVWAWVFDMTDEQAISTIKEMDELVGATSISVNHTEGSDSIKNIDLDINGLLDKKLEHVVSSIKNSITSSFDKIKTDLDERLSMMNYRIDSLGESDGVSGSGDLNTIFDKLEAIQKQIGGSSKVVETIPNPINLLESSDRDISLALTKVGANKNHVQSAINAIQYWKRSDYGLTLENLEMSAKAKSEDEYKIEGFAMGTYKKLQKVAFIPEI